MGLLLVLIVAVVLLIWYLLGTNRRPEELVSDENVPLEMPEVEEKEPEEEQEPVVYLPADDIVSNIRWNIYAGQADTSRYYVYTDVIELREKGSKLNFADPNNGLIPSSGFTVTYWTKDGEKWVRDPNGYNNDGKDKVVKETDEDGKSYFSYTSQEDGENIRLGYYLSFPSVYQQQTVEQGSAVDWYMDNIAGTEGEALAVNWYEGYVSSSLHPNVSRRDQLFPNGRPNNNRYVYSDVIELGPSGTKVTFVDFESGTTSDVVYVVSSWVRSGDDWVLDINGVNIPAGSSDVMQVVNGLNVYSYVSSRDGECIRFCFRAGNEEELPGTQAYFEKVLPTIYRSQSNEAGTAESWFQVKEAEEDGEAKLETNWYSGYISSNLHPTQARKNQLIANGKPYNQHYIYTDVLTMGAAGSTVTFTVPSDDATAQVVYVVSSWKKEESGWVLDLDGTNIVGGSTKVEKHKNGTTTYTYTSMQDNECIRFCINNDSLGTVPVLYMY